jgi:DNA-binding MarR family transcriptional regulator
MVWRGEKELVRAMIAARRDRDRFFPADLFADPAWDMLLDLYAARIEHQPVSVSSLCIAAAVPATTALRWIGQLAAAGLIERTPHRSDKRKVMVSLTQGGIDAMRGYLYRERAA